MQQPLRARAIGAALVALAVTAFASLPVAAATTAANDAASAPMRVTPLPPVPPKKPPPAPVKPVDINSASRNQLMTLPGIGAAEADKIIANRPYLTKTELVTKGVLPTGPFVSLRHQVVAMPTKETKAMLAGKR